ncbi:hypothetical protein BpHYR1_038891 [Brachionus plicatilis]|uniref:Uncharacterized protein n=1 Tax=Brachionus plicatilis TaxID=10195 RepID=A0A3M7PLP2_BRAPC|nr:hypothetical protein BpHYR1_038891 [Brachionus plicatilis]
MCQTVQIQQGPRRPGSTGWGVTNVSKRHDIIGLQNTLQFSAFCTLLKSILNNCVSTLQSFCRRQSFVVWIANVNRRFTRKIPCLVNK